MTTREGSAGQWLRWGLVMCSVGAAAIHFVAAGAHLDHDTVAAIFLVTVAWLQVAWAIAMARRPTHRLLVLGTLNALVVVVWILSRTTGVPFVDQSTQPEDVGSADLLASVLEGLVALGCFAVVLRPSLPDRSFVRHANLGLVALAIVIAASTTVVLGPLLDGHDDAHAAGLDGSTPCEQSGPPVFAGQNEAHGHRGPSPSVAITDAETRAELATQIEEARAVAARLPTVADAIADGYRQVTQYEPCIGAHYISNENVDDAFDPRGPEMLLYHGTDDTSALVGLSYAVVAPEPPEGFAGPNDAWHSHQQFCFDDETEVIIGDDRINEAQCEEAGGHLVGTGRLWMNHVWVVPGWESSWGLFSSEHPDLGELEGVDG